MAEEKRVDPASKECYTFEELKKVYADTYQPKELKEYWDSQCEPVKPKRVKSKAEKAGLKSKTKAKTKTKAGTGEVTSGFKTGKDKGAPVLAKLKSYAECVIAEYVWLDAKQVPRSKTTTLTCRPTKVSDLKVWNFDGSSTGQADGHNSEISLHPRAFFNDPFRGFPHVLVLAEAQNAWDDKPAIGNTRAAAAEVFERYQSLDPWFGMEQEYTLMRLGRVGDEAKVPLGFNPDSSEPASQGPYYTGVGAGIAIGRAVAEEHYRKCLEAGVKVSGMNANVMPGQWEYQVGPCRGIEMGDHLTMARYIMLRVTELHDVVCSLIPKPIENGQWNGAACHTGFSIAPMRTESGYDAIVKVCEAMGAKVKEHIEEYGEGSKHADSFTFGVGDRGASIRIPHDSVKNKKGYLEDRRPAANCDPYRVTARMLQTAGEAYAAEEVETGSKKHAAFLFIKPHAVQEKVKDVVKQKLGEAGLVIASEGEIKAQKIDKQKLIDTHYGAIAARAVKQQPTELVVQPKAQDLFKEKFGLLWADALAQGLVYNAVKAAEKLGISPGELGKKFDGLKKDVDLIKFGGGFYCGRVDGIYVINGFYLNMRSKYTAPGSSIYYFEVEWKSESLSWADFRGKVLGPTDPSSAPENSLRGIIYKNWEELGLKAKPDTGDNGVHASASPFEALAERANWLGVPIAKDFFGRAMLAAGVPLKMLKEWFEDPSVQFDGGKKSLFDLLEDLDAGDVLKKSPLIVAANQ